ncbi:Carnitinyl-CoA dehydratase [Pseudomonas sp. MM221]|nr:Carnitinyl-CoA dehydratase [Pseudomonas sp. MM221]
MNDLITRELDQGLLTLAFNRPDKLNALNTAMYQQLGDLLLAAGEDPGVDAIILTGGAHCFTAGNDLRDFLDNPPTDLDSPVFRLMRVVMGLDKPLIAAVSGAAIGIGATLLLHCDQVLVSRSTKLRMPFAPLGVCPEFGASLLLPRLLGQARAARLLLANELLDGEQAVAWGLACMKMANSAWPQRASWRGSCKATRRRRCASASGCSRTANGPSWRKPWRGKAGCLLSACAPKKHEPCCEG